MSGKVVHSKLNGQGFVSTKEKLSKCVKRLLKMLEDDKAHQENTATGVSQTTK
jgi:hypothetical protein